jgi:trans-aconitate 2-methyltransferase
MPTWNAEQYLRFAAERTRPCRDLAAAVGLDAPRRVIDLGCGPGNSTAVLAARWPSADIVGLDSSQAMIDKATQDAPGRSFVLGDIATWEPEAPYDLVFSNAAMQWIGGHERLYPRIVSGLAQGGAFAAQVPCNMDAPAHTLMRDLAATPEFHPHLGEGVREWHVHDGAFYYDVLSPVASRIDIWETEYLHVLPDASAIVEWYKGTGLRPFLDKLPDEAIRARFLDAYRERVTAAYPARRDGRVLLPFQRLFVIAYR